MKFILMLAPFLFVLTPSRANNGGCLHDSQNFRCVEVLSNYDGDTLTVNIPGIHPLIGKKVSVRVNGIDTPELKTSNTCEKQAGRIAQKLVSHLVKSAKRVDLTNVERDKYFRILADVIIDGKSLKSILLKNKLAYEYHGGTKETRDWCLIAKRFPASKK